MTVPVITPLPTPPSRADTVNFASRADAFLLALPTFAEESNEVASYLNNMSDSVAAYDALASYRGTWIALFGALSMPATVSHSGNIYALTENIPSAQAHEPGVSTAWQLIRAKSTDISHDAGTVSSALSTLQAEIDTNSNNITAINTTISTTLMPKSGGIFTSDVSLPSINGGQLAGFRNKIINGKMEIAQRGSSTAAAPTNTYLADRWVLGYSTSAVVTTSQQTDVPDGSYFQNSIKVQVTTADTSIAAGDHSSIGQFIEGYNVRDLIGHTFTLSFWVKSSKTGKHCISFRNAGPDRSYVSEYTILAANTWEYKTITVTGGLITAGTWYTNTNTGLIVAWSLANGATYQAPTTNTWQTGNLLGTAQQVNVLDTVGNTFAITGVQLELGDRATLFEHRHYGSELSLCQRYFYRHSNYGQIVGSSTAGLASYGASVGAGAYMWAISSFPTTMRVNPSASVCDIIGNVGRLTVYTSAAGSQSNGILPYGVATSKDTIVITDYNNAKYGLAATYQVSAEYTGF